jgi:uncharacterized protein (DUF169 family)
MEQAEQAGLKGLLEALGYHGEPLGMHYTDDQPRGGFSPEPARLPSLEEERAGQADLGEVFGSFSCVMGHIWRARNKDEKAWFSAERFGCLGGAFYLGYLKPQLDSVCAYVSTGVPGVMEGERYIHSPEACRAFFEELDPPPAGGRYCVFQPLSHYGPEERPEIVLFFARPEVLSGLMFLAMFVTGDMEATASPFGAGCSHLVTFPRRYQAAGRRRAVAGGWDPSCRKYLRPDELSFAAPWEMFRAFLERWEESFLTTATWGLVRKKARLSAKAWGENAKE